MYKISVRALICDAPAKSCCILQHTGYYSCSKCHIKGEYQHQRVCFPNTNMCSERTDLDFRQKSNSQHHSDGGVSLLEQLPQLDMVQNVASDYKHLICLGAMRKVLHLWCDFDKCTSKLSRSDISKISDFLVLPQSYTLFEFNRKPRSLLEVKRWKATEYRQFLFYTGPVIFKSVLPSSHFNNFLAWCVGSVILANEHFHENRETAQSLLKYFVDSFKSLYGSYNMSHNIHNLLHIVNDVKKFGPLDTFSAFPFENKNKLQTKKYTTKIFTKRRQAFKSSSEKNL